MLSCVCGVLRFIETFLNTAQHCTNFIGHSTLVLYSFSSLFSTVCTVLLSLSLDDFRSLTHFSLLNCLNSPNVHLFI